MKRFVFLIFIIMFNIAFSSTHLSEAEFNVRLKLIEPIQVEVNQHMSFGVIEKGTEKTAEATFTLKGEVGKNYNIVISENSELKHNENYEEKIPVSLTLNKSSAGEIFSEETEFKIIGTANYAQERELQSGEYSGTIVLRVNYN